jgi:hypothetical protein
VELASQRINDLIITITQDNFPSITFTELH